MVLMKACPLKLTVNCSRRRSLRSDAEGHNLRQDRPNNTKLPVDTHNLGGNPEYDYIDLDKLDTPQDQSHDMGLDNGTMYEPYSTITGPGVSDRNPYENIRSSTEGREPGVTDEIPADAVMEEMDGYGEYGNDGDI